MPSHLLQPRSLGLQMSSCPRCRHRCSSHTAPSLPPGALTPTSKLLRFFEPKCVSIVGTTWASTMGTTWGALGRRRGGAGTTTWGRRRRRDDATTRRRRRHENDATRRRRRRDDDATTIRRRRTTRRRRRCDDDTAAATSARVAGASQLHHRCIKQGGASARDQVQDR